MTFEYDKSTERLVEKLKKEATTYGGKIIGDSKDGLFEVKSKIGLFKGKYNISGKIITIVLEKKPLLISQNLIKEQIKKYLSNN